VEHVDLRLVALDRFDRGLDLAEVRAGGWRRRCRRAGTLDFRLEVANGTLDVRKKVDGVDVGLNALQGGLQLLVHSDADVFDRRPNLVHHPFDRLTHVSIDRARDSSPRTAINPPDAVSWRKPGREPNRTRDYRLRSPALPTMLPCPQCVFSLLCPRWRRFL